ncbi:GntR family transcriptional regulator [Leucobacter sp.]
MASSISLPERHIKRPESLVRDQVADYLRDAIFRLALAPGTPLIEREICEATTASRATVREAIRQLESEGLVRSAQGRGTIVAGLTTAEAQDIYEIRGRLEALASRLFVERASPRLLRALEASVEELAEVADSPADMTRLKTDFYEILFEGAGNAELQRISHGLRQRIMLAQASSLSIPGRSRTSLQEIQEIVAAISRRDADAAERLTLAHIQAASRTVAEFRAMEEDAS